MVVGRFGRLSCARAGSGRPSSPAAATPAVPFRYCLRVIVTTVSSWFGCSRLARYRVAGRRVAASPDVQDTEMHFLSEIHSLVPPDRSEAHTSELQSLMRTS